MTLHDIPGLWVYCPQFTCTLKVQEHSFILSAFLFQSQLKRISPLALRKNALDQQLFPYYRSFIPELWFMQSDCYCYYIIPGQNLFNLMSSYPYSGRNHVVLMSVYMVWMHGYSKYRG